MRRFLYYFPRVGGMNPTMLAEFGALDRFTGSGGKLIEHGIRAVNDGPAGAGCIVAAGAHASGKGSQWMEGEKFWVGLEDFAPGPEDLARETGIEGYELQMADGNPWRVPLIHRWDSDKLEHTPNVPKTLWSGRSDGAFKCESRIRPEYAAVDALATRLFGDFAAERTIAFAQGMRDAVQLLAVNYRLGVEEASLIGLLDEASMVRVLASAIDLPKLHAAAAAMAEQGLYHKPADLTKQNHAREE